MSPSKIKDIPKARKKKGKKKRGDLLRQLVSITGISGRTIRQELQEILERKQINLHDITLDQLRSVAACYARQIMAIVLEREGKQGPLRP